MQGLFKPAHPEKYRGNLKQIIYRSSWEMCAFSQLDRNRNVIEWNSEEIVIPYISPLDGHQHRYFVDLWVKYSDGKIKLIEIKPLSQVNPPKQPKRNSPKFLREAAEWGKNQAKWKAAKRYAEDRGWTFEVWTERDLGIG